MVKPQVFRNPTALAPSTTTDQSNGRGGGDIFGPTIKVSAGGMQPTRLCMGGEKSFFFASLDNIWAGTLTHSAPPDAPQPELQYSPGASADDGDHELPARRAVLPHTLPSPPVVTAWHPHAPHTAEIQTLCFAPGSSGGGGFVGSIDARGVGQVTAVSPSPGSGSCGMDVDGAPAAGSYSLAAPGPIEESWAGLTFNPQDCSQVATAYGLSRKACIFSGGALVRTLHTSQPVTNLAFLGAKASSDSPCTLR
eukprot:gnl/Hemi2/7774_TR2683_c0_g2_i1.p1 gnl/Hemi2/7774_TR2683_c0_g2~~gnl/Hemi2/7774_TR2683_c0_g2_i1.p1  ORF type:complete len:264 (+),score=68.12 gnl/Hemi2/7774_TR2683_c0_g2_i1:42-794(+)